MVHLSQSHIQRPHCPLSGSSVPISASPIFTVPSIGGLTKLGYVPPLVPTFKQYRARYDTTPPLLDMAVRKTNVNGNGAIEWMSYHRLADGSLYTMPYRMSEFVSDSPSSTSLRRYACPKDVVPSVDNAVQPLSFEQRDVRAKLEGRREG